MKRTTAYLLDLADIYCDASDKDMLRHLSLESADERWSCEPRDRLQSKCPSS